MYSVQQQIENILRQHPILHPRTAPKVMEVGRPCKVVKLSARIDHRLPSPSEIADRAAEVRQGWSDEEFARRAPHLASVPWEMPEWTPPDDFT